MDSFFEPFEEVLRRYGVRWDPRKDDLPELADDPEERAQVLWTALADHVLPALKLNTSRLMIRRARRDNADAMFPLFSDERIFRLHSSPYCYPERDANYRGWFAETCQGLFYALLRKDTAQVIGFISLAEDDTRAMPCWSVEITMHPEYWRQGYAEEAMTAMLHACFGDLHMEMLTAGCPACNEPALRMMDKLGFTREGALRKARYLSAFGRVEEIPLSMLYEEWCKEAPTHG